jgi:hypothetical protein
MAGTGLVVEIQFGDAVDEVLRPDRSTPPHLSPNIFSFRSG